MLKRALLSLRFLAADLTNDGTTMLGPRFLGAPYRMKKQGEDFWVSFTGYRRWIILRWANGSLWQWASIASH